MFYFWPNPYARIWNWGLWLLGAGIVTFAISYFIVDYAIIDNANPQLNKAYADASSGYKEFANNLRWKFGLINGLAAFILAAIYSMGIKSLSPIKMHIPF